MRRRGRPIPSPLLLRPLLFSGIIHLVVFIILTIIPSLRLPWRERPLSVTWVELPKGTSEDIGTGIKKTETLPRSTIEEQKRLFEQQQQPLPAEKKKVETLKKEEPQKPKLAEPSKTAKKEKAVSTADQKMKDALSKINRDLKKRSAPPEAAQIKESGEGYQYGTGTEPLRVPVTDPEYLKYQALVRAKIINEWIIPPIQAETEGGPRLNARLSVMVNNDGEVVTTEWESHSGNASFDASCLRAVSRSSPFPRPPDRLAWEAYNEGFLIEFDPRLKP